MTRSRPTGKLPLYRHADADRVRLTFNQPVRS
jgi:hypothetical protein